MNTSCNLYFPGQIRKQDHSEFISYVSSCVPARFLMCRLVRGSGGEPFYRVSAGI